VNSDGPTAPRSRTTISTARSRAFSWSGCCDEREARQGVWTVWWQIHSCPSRLRFTSAVLVSACGSRIGTS
jgi:hypothetical protein